MDFFFFFLWEKETGLLLEQESKIPLFLHFTSLSGTSTISLSISLSKAFDLTLSLRPPWETVSTHFLSLLSGDNLSLSILAFSFSDVDITRNFLPLIWPFLLSSPSGKLVQIEHALTAVGSGQTSLGIKGKNLPLKHFSRVRYFRWIDDEIWWAIANRDMEKGDFGIGFGRNLAVALWKWFFFYLVLNEV